MGYASVINELSNFIPRVVLSDANYRNASRMVVGSALVGAAVVTEMACRTISDGIAILRHDTGNYEQSLATLKDNFSANLGGVLFYGICASNVIPGIAALGAVIFAGYSIFKRDAADDYLTTQFIKHTDKVVSDLVTPSLDFVVATASNLLKAALKTMTKVHELLSTVTDAILSVISLPEHPVWIATSCLVTAIVVIKVAFPALAVH